MIYRQIDLPSATSLLAAVFLFLTLGCGDGVAPPQEKPSAGEDDTGVPDAGEDSDSDTGDTELGEIAGLLIDDFEDGDEYSLLGGAWFVYDDLDNEGASTIEAAADSDGNLVMDGEGYESEHSMHVSYALDQGDYAYQPYVGWGVNLAEDASDPFDVSAFEGISYLYKGSAHRLHFETFNVEDYDYYFTTMPASDHWTRAKVPFSYLHQEGWGAVADLELDNVHNLSWQAKGDTGEEGEVWLDDIILMETAATDDDTPDMEILDPSPPDDAQLDTVEIDTPLQALAMSSLDRGYNITNWLEEKKFDGFDYDEDFVARLADNGFGALRLPIDLDLYIADREDYFAGDAELDIDPDLFTVLSNFDEWTAAHGLGLTIDYHQYDGSFDMDDPLYVEAVIQLWEAVALHFADNPREDLFFEIMNEPELAGDTNAVSQDEWTAFAEDIITAIRAADTAHAILFGDVSWNAIAPLVQRTPFEDADIIYVVHFYEPYVFTHQGASWADMGTTHDIPYPYSVERWSESSRDFGFIPNLQADWEFSALYEYYRTGNKSYMRNQLIEAKAWAVENNVPVICNEFGAYDATSRLEDRANYYADIVDIFEELEMPWQHWFMIMDKDTGDIDPDLKAAFGL